LTYRVQRRGASPSGAGVFVRERDFVELQLLAEGDVGAEIRYGEGPAVEVGHHPCVQVALWSCPAPDYAVFWRKVGGCVFDVDDELDVWQHTRVGESNDGAVEVVKTGKSASAVTRAFLLVDNVELIDVNILSKISRSETVTYLSIVQKDTNLTVSIRFIGLVK